jgi:hypothetical protein
MFHQGADIAAIIHLWGFQDGTSNEPKFPFDYGFDVLPNPTMRPRTQYL